MATETTAAGLPFTESAAGDSIEANAGEPGLAIESVQTPTFEAETSAERPLEVVTLETEAPESGSTAAVEVTPAAHPTVPI